MPVAVAVETREAAVFAYQQGEGTIAEVAARFGISAPALARFLRMQRSGAGLAPKVQRRPGKPKLDADAMEALKALVHENPTMPLENVLRELEKRTSTHVSVGAGRRALRRLGIRCVKPPKRPGQPASPRAPDRARYTDAQRGSDQTYPTELTDAEWEVVRPHFDGPRGRGRPPKYGPRAMLDAMFYVVRSGCAWRLLPAEYPPWEAVYKQFRRWTGSGRLRAVHDDLRRMWRARAGRTAEPSAIIVDSQSARTTEKGGLAATTPARW